jgi:hypothetical protein
MIVARWDNPESDIITIQDFIVGGRSMISIFSDQERFREETRGSGFEAEGVEIDRAFLASLLSGKEFLVLNPGSINLPITKADIEAGSI